jgi:polar amino acid transport system substrate-binding protein
MQIGRSSRLPATRISAYDIVEAPKIEYAALSMTRLVWTAAVRWISFTSLSICAILAATLCSAEPIPRPDAARDLQSIVDAKVLRVALTRFNLPAFHSRRADGTLAGKEIEMAQQIGRALGVDVAFIEDAESFDAVIDLVATGMADIGISKLSQSYRRLHRVRFSEPYITLRHAFLFNRLVIARDAERRAPAAVLQGFKGRIGVIGGSAYVDFARLNFPAATVMEARTWEDAIASLLEGRVDAVYRDEFEIRRIVKANPALNVKFGTAAIVDQHALLSIAICDSCAKLQELINYHLARTKGSLTLKALLAAEDGE